MNSYKKSDSGLNPEKIKESVSLVDKHHSLSMKKFSKRNYSQARRKTEN